MPGKLLRAGDVSIDQVLLVTVNGAEQDITLQVLGFEIYEDIFAPFITGKLFVNDSQEIENLLPLVGEEVVKLRISTPELPDVHSFDNEFCVYKMEDKVRYAERALSYVLYICSKEAIVDLNQKTSRAYEGEIHKIVEKLIIDEDGLMSPKLYALETTKNKTKFVSNFWSPVRSINYLCKLAYNKNDSPSYLFYENKYGFNFVTLDSLYDKEVDPHYTFIWDNYTAAINPVGGSSRSMGEDYSRVLEQYNPASFNYMDRVQSGMYGSEIIYYDIMTKQYVHKGFNPAINWDMSNHLNEYPLFSDNVAAGSKAVLIYGKQYYNNFEGFKDETTATKVIQKRLAILSAANANKCTIVVWGRTDYTAGDKVRLEVPLNTQIVPGDDPLNKVQSGNYIIGSLCHKVTRDDYRCSMELIRDSMMVNLNG